MYQVVKYLKLRLSVKFPYTGQEMGENPKNSCVEMGENPKVNIIAYLVDHCFH